MADGMMNKNHYSRTEKVKNCLPVITNLIKKEHGSILFCGPDLSYFSFWNRSTLENYTLVPPRSRQIHVLSANKAPSSEVYY